MLPKVNAIDRIEMLRDGGSLNASFIGDDGKQYWLLFGLSSEVGPGGELVRLGYERPIVFERVERRPDTMTVQWSSVDPVELSWPDAHELLKRMREIHPADSDAKWLNSMAHVAETEGALPPGIERVLGPPRR